MNLAPALSAISRMAVRRNLYLAPADAGQLPEADPTRSYLLYIHVPFCEELCTYCSFYSIGFSRDVAARYFEALLRELETYHRAGYRFDSIYIGGGTPTVLPDELNQLILRARELWPIEGVSVETNPHHLNERTVDLLLSAGVGRLSVGVQTFDDEMLKRFGRAEVCGTAESARERIESIRGRFETLNIDMIYNYPGQTGAMLERDIETVLGLDVDQVTFYPLMMSEATRGAVKSSLGHFSRSRESHFHKLLHEKMSSRYGRASAWCYSRPGRQIDEYIVEHDEYVGVGAGAFGYVGGTMLANMFDVERYIETVGDGRAPLQARRRFGAAQRARYDLLMGLFGQGADLSRIAEKHGRWAGLCVLLDAVLMCIAGIGRMRRGVVRVDGPRSYYTVVMMREFLEGVSVLREKLMGAPAADSARRE